MPTRETTIRLSVADNFSAQLRSFASQIDNADKATGRLATGTTDLSRHYDTLARQSTRAGTVLLGVGAAGVVAGVGLFKMGAAFEQTEVAFTHMLGSGERAQAFLQELRDFAERTPFQFLNLTVSTKQLLAYGFAAEDLIPILTDVGDAVSGLGAGQEGIERVTRALGQMLTAGKVNARDMLQLTEVGIPAWRYLADSIGVTVAEVQKLSEKGLIPADQALQAIRAGMREDFGGLMAKQAQTAAGQLSNLVDELQALGVSLGEGLLPTAKAFISTARDMVGGFNELEDATRAEIVQFGLFNTGLALAVGGILVAIPKIIALKDAWIALRAIQAAGGIGGALVTAAGPVGAVVAGVLAAVEVNKLYNIQLTESIAKLKATEPVVRGLNVTYDQYRQQMEAAARGQGLLITSTGDLVRVAKTADGTGRIVIQTNFLQAQSQYDLAQAMKVGADSFDPIIDRNRALADRSAYLADQLFKTTTVVLASTAADADLALAEFELEEATTDLAAALEELAKNTDPKKFEELRGKVLEAQAAFFGAADGVTKLREEMEKVPNFDLSAHFERSTRFSGDWLTNLEDLVSELGKYERAHGSIIPPARDLAGIQLDAAIAADNYAAKVRNLNDAQADLAETQQKLAEATDPEEIAELAGNAAQLEADIRRAQKAVMDSAGAMDEAAGAANNAAGGIANYSGKIGELSAQIRNSLVDIFTQSLVTQLEQIGKMAEEGLPGMERAYDNVFAALEKLNPELARQMEISHELALLTDDLTGAVEGGKITSDEYTDIILGMNEAIEKGIPLVDAIKDAHIRLATAAGDAGKKIGTVITETDKFREKNTDDIDEFAAAFWRLAGGAGASATSVGNLLFALNNMPSQINVPQIPTGGQVPEGYGLPPSGSYEPPSPVEPGEPGFYYGGTGGPGPSRREGITFTPTQTASNSTSTTWNGDLYVMGSPDPKATAAEVIQVLQDRGMVPQTLLR